MGFLSKLFGGSKAALADHIYKTKVSKHAAMLQQAKAALEQGEYPLIVCHFSEDLESAQELFNEAGIPAVLISKLDRDRLNYASGLVKEGNVGIISSNCINKPGGEARKDPEGTVVQVILFEHFPTTSRDDLVLSLDKQLSAPLRFHCYTSLEDDLLLAFGGGRISELLEQFGFEEGEELSGGMLNNSVRNAQKKLGKELGGAELPADSREEWAAKNLRKE